MNHDTLGIFFHAETKNAFEYGIRDYKIFPSYFAPSAKHMIAVGYNGRDSVGE